MVVEKHVPPNHLLHSYQKRNVNLPGVMAYVVLSGRIQYTHALKNAEFGNLIPEKFCFWREIFAILRGYLSFRWIF